MMDDFPGADQLFQELIVPPAGGSNSISPHETDTDDLITDLLGRDWSDSNFLSSRSAETLPPGNEPPLLVRDAFFSPISLAKPFHRIRESPNPRPSSLSGSTPGNKSSGSPLHTKVHEEQERQSPQARKEAVTTEAFLNSTPPPDSFKRRATNSIFRSSMSERSQKVDAIGSSGNAKLVPPVMRFEFSLDDNDNDASSDKKKQSRDQWVRNAENPRHKHLKEPNNNNETSLLVQEDGYDDDEDGNIDIDQNASASVPCLVPRSKESSRTFVRWTPEEDELLKQAIDNERQGTIIPWKRISVLYFQESRNHNQCRGRWKKSLKPGLNQGAWTEEEDEHLKQLRADGLSWTEISKKIPGRTAEHLQNRFSNVLDPSLRKDPFTEDERNVVFDAQRRLGNKWKAIAKLLPGRSESMVKNFWHNSKMIQRRALRRAARKGLKQKKK